MFQKLVEPQFEELMRSLSFSSREKQFALLTSSKQTGSSSDAPHVL